MHKYIQRIPTSYIYMKQRKFSTLKPYLVIYSWFVIHGHCDSWTLTYLEINVFYENTSLD